MATKKAAGSTKNLHDSKPKYLGVKLYDGERARIGSIIVRQRGTRYAPGNNTLLGKDHTIFASKEGVVRFSEKRHTNFDGNTKRKKVVSVS